MKVYLQKFVKQFVSLFYCLQWQEILYPIQANIAAKWMELEYIMLSEASQILHSLSYVKAKTVNLNIE
jgi:hypothetical protein